MKILKVPESTIVRLSMYSRYLTKKYRIGIKQISSDDIAEGVGVKSPVVRKDLAYFGEFGIRGVGYNTLSLNNNILKILNLDLEWNIALVGLGSLGRALASYEGFIKRKLIIKNIFDNDPKKVGTKINGIEVLSTECMENEIWKNRISIGIISTPAFAAQETANSFVKAKVKAILNFAPIALNVPSYIEIRNVDLSVNLEVMSFNMSYK
ncbi:redox-sensing transcriptional repressor Rex [Desulfitobacterium sp. AusDCA]|uniref:redox-sensing transcriptional repressor Rex n=1 Tax=Desulfitobacterium sp. AusDCA TaxID=3240383 RepID=UPI003DA7479A